MVATTLKRVFLLTPPARRKSSDRAPLFNPNQVEFLLASKFNAGKKPSRGRLNGGSFAESRACSRRLKAQSLHVVHVAVAQETARCINFRERARTSAELVEHSNADGLADNVRAPDITGEFGYGRDYSVYRYASGAFGTKSGGKSFTGIETAAGFTWTFAASQSSGIYGGITVQPPSGRIIFCIRS